MYTAESLQVPWYQSLGNRDYQGIVQAQLSFSSDPRWTLPSRSYTFSVPISSGSASRAIFIVLDTSPFVLEYYTNPQTPEQYIQLSTQHWEDQLEWFNQTIRELREQNPTDWIFVIGHHPIVSAASSETDQWMTASGGTPLLVQYIQPQLWEYGVTTFFNGHIHQLQQLQDEQGVDYIISGAGSRIKLDDSAARSFPGYTVNFQEVVPGFVVVELQEETMEVLYVDYQGNIPYQYSRGK